MQALKIQTTQKGFTLVETLVALTILLLVIIGPMTVAQKGIQNAYFANEQVTAVFLAQEAIEAIRELRDNAALEAYELLIENDGGGDTSFAAWVPSPSCSSGCAFDIDDNAFEVCNEANNNDCQLIFDEAEGRYTHQGAGVDSPFRRVVTIDAVTTDGGRLVTVEVTGEGKVFGGTPQTVTLQTWIYDHYRRFE